MEWSGEAVVIGVRKHGETSAIVDVFARDRGRHSGLVRGGISRKLRPVLQPGNTVTVEWRARLDGHLGNFTVEPMEMRAASLMEDRLALAALQAACALAREVLPERQALPELYNAFQVLLDNLHEQEVWPAVFIRWELGLLEALGYGLDLRACAATGSNDGLAYVSPRSGRAVSASAGEPYRDRMLKLPGFLTGDGVVRPEDVADGFALTGYFLESRVFWGMNRPMPDVRARMVDSILGATAP